MTPLVLPLIVRENVEPSTRIVYEVNACAAAAAPRYDSEAFDLGKVLGSGGLAVLKKPPDQRGLLASSRALFVDAYSVLRHAAQRLGNKLPAANTLPSLVPPDAARAPRVHDPLRRRPAADRTAR
jgi:hypothetical protein